MYRRTFSALVMLTTLGCGSSNDGPAAPAALPAAAAPSLSGVIASASGSAHRIRPLPDGDLWVLTFNAEKRADGSVTGYAHVDRKDLGESWDVDVTCMSVVGNRAWIAGIIRNGRGTIVRDGTVSYFYVDDNGDGEGAPPDRASAVRLNDRDGEDQVFCTLRPTALPLSDIAHGNVQVR